MRSPPVRIAVGLVVLVSFAAAVVVSGPFEFLGEARGVENQSTNGLASFALAPNSQGGTVVVTLPAGTLPGGVAHNTGNGYVYVANFGSGNVTVINDTTIVASLFVGVSPVGVGYNNGNGYVYVANSYSNDVSVIDGTTVVATVVAGDAPQGVAYDGGNGYVYVTNIHSNNVSVIDGTSMVASVPVGTYPFGVAYNNGNGYVYVANMGSNDVSVIDGTTVVATVPVGYEPNGVTYDSRAGYVYVSNRVSGSLSVISETSVVATVLLGAYPAAVAYNSGNGFVYVANYASNNVSVVSGTTVVGAVPVGNWPDGIAYDAGNGYVYVANAGSYDVSVFSTITPPLVSFTETGLPAGTSWTVTLDGSSNSSTSTTIAFAAPNGSYSYVMGIVPGFIPAPFSGSVTVNGVPVDVTISFKAFKFEVRFAKTGLPFGTPWSVTLAGATQNSTDDVITFLEPNGTYPFSVGPVSGYTPHPSLGLVTVSGRKASASISFTEVLPTFLGLPAAEGYALVVGPAIAAVSLGALYVLRRARERTGNRPKPPQRQI